MNAMIVSCCAATLVASHVAVVDPARGVPRGEQPEAESPAAVVDSFQIGSSRAGRAIEAFRIHLPGVEQPDAQPGLVIVAGIDARHRVGVDVARGLVERLGQSPPESLAGRTVYIVPMLNPDGFEALKGGPRRDDGRTPTPDDADHDGRVDEDGPVDLNGDGLITMMRVERPMPATGLDAGYVVDGDDPRVMRSPDESKGEVAIYALLVEGRDQDGDGLIAEDGPGGVDLNRNFAYLWPEFEDGAGQYQMSELESRALAAWMLSRDNIVAVLTLGPHDTLAKIPDAGKMDKSGRVPKGIEKGDKPDYERVSKVFKEITSITGGGVRDYTGSLVGWAYADLGVYSFATPVWVRPDLVKTGDEAKGGGGGDAGNGAEAEEKGPETIQVGPISVELTREGVASAMAELQGMSDSDRREMFQAMQALPQKTRERFRAFMRGRGDDSGRRPRRGGRGGSKKPKSASSDDGKWLKYSDEKRDGEGFVAWADFDHPDLGTVQIGGIVPGFKWNPPADEVEGLIDQQGRFVGRLLGMFPVLTVEEQVVEDRGGGVWHLSVRVLNEGELATRSAMGAKTRRLPPMRIEIDVPQERVLAGRRRVSTRSIAGGDSFVAQWTIIGAPGDEIAIRIVSAALGDRDVTARLGEQQERQ